MVIIYNIILTQKCLEFYHMNQIIYLRKGSNKIRTMDEGYVKIILKNYIF